jgi:hypothetical protein
MTPAQPARRARAGSDRLITERLGAARMHALQPVQLAPRHRDGAVIPAQRATAASNAAN